MGVAKRKRRFGPVSFRLGREAWPVFVGQAERDGVTWSAYAERVVTAAVLQRKAQER